MARPTRTPVQGGEHAKGTAKVALILTAEKRQRLESFAHRSRSAAALARRPDDGRVAVVVPIAS